MYIETEADPAGTQRQMIEQQDLIRELRVHGCSLASTSLRALPTRAARACKLTCPSARSRIPFQIASPAEFRRTGDRRVP